MLSILLNSCYITDNEEYSINRVDNYTGSSLNSNGWLIMIYISGTGTLEEESITDINNIKDGYLSLSSIQKDNIDIVILHDRGPEYSTSDGDWTGTYLYKCDSNGLTPIETATGWRETVDQEENMGSKETLKEFISWSRTNYNRPQNSLIIWNHGGGLSGQQLERARAVSWDTENTTGEINNALYINEIQEILGTQYSSNSKLDVLGFDACYMGMIEIAYEFRETVDYMVASAGTEVGGWRYKNIISGLTANTTSIDLTKKIVTTYKEFNTTNGLKNTLCSLELDKVVSIKENIDALAIKMKNIDYTDIKTIRDSTMKYYDETVTDENILYPYVDIGYLMDQLKSIPSIKTESEAVLSTLSSLIITSFGTEITTPFYADNNNRGLSIFFSDSNKNYSLQGWYTGEDTGTYGNIDFCNNNNTNFNWKVLMDHYFDE